MIPKIADLRASTTQPLLVEAFERDLGQKITSAHALGARAVTVEGLNDFPEVRERLLAEGYTLRAWRDMCVTTTISWS